MSDSVNQNPFLPPHAAVADPDQARDSEVVDATRLQRLLAVLVDIGCGIAMVVLMAIYIAATGGFTSWLHPEAGMPSGFVGAMLISSGIGLAWMIVNGVWAYRYGQVIGKRLVGIRVVRTDGSRVSFGRLIFMRWGLLWLITVVASIICALIHLPLLADLVYLVDVLLIFRASRLCLHDQLGDTRVVTAESSMHATLAGSRGDHLPVFTY